MTKLVVLSKTLDTYFSRWQTDKMEGNFANTVLLTQIDSHTEKSKYKKKK